MTDKGMSMKRSLLLLPLLLCITGCEPSRDTTSPTAYCSRVAGQVVAITSLRDGDMSAETTKAVLSVDAMADRERTQTLRIIDIVYDQEHLGSDALKMKIELMCHQERWTPVRHDDFIMVPVP